MHKSETLEYQWQVILQVASEKRQITSQGEIVGMSGNVQFPMKLNPSLLKENNC